MVRGLSLVVPAFNEEARLPATLRVASRALQAIAARAEILVVDDGSVDATSAVARAVVSPVPIRVLRQNRNLGKGSAVARGVQAAQYELIAFTDADSPYDLGALEPMARAVETGLAEIAIGARDLPGSEINRGYGRLRRVSGQALSTLTFRLLGLPIRDSQCGLKLFRAEVARELFAMRRVQGFGFDFEILILALVRGYSIKRFPVRLTHDDDSRLQVLRDSARMFFDLLAVRRRLRRGGLSREARPGLGQQLDCPLCAGAGFVERAERRGWRMVECEDCGLWRLRPMPSDIELLALYGDDYFQSPLAQDVGYDGYGSDGELRCETFRRRLLALGRAGTGERMVDVGGGYGFMADAARGHFAERWVVEPSASAAARIAPDHHLAATSWQDARLPASTFDLVSMQDALEHLPEPRRALEQAFESLRPGGRLLLVTPDRASVLARLQGEDWVSLKFPEHVVLFDGAGLAALLRDLGFEVCSVRAARQVVSIGFLAERAGRARPFFERVLPAWLRAMALEVPSGSIEIVAQRPHPT